MPDNNEVDNLLARTKAIVDTIVDGVITISEKGLIETVNPATERIFGYQSEELQGRNVSMLMPAPYREEHDGYLANYRNTGERKIIGIGREVQGRRKDGSTFPLELAVSEMIVNGERMFTGIVRDISERKETEEKLRAAMQRVHEQRIKDEFIATVSHELRTPLTSIKASLELIAGGAAGELPDNANMLVGIASKNSERLLMLINDILDISKLESEKMQFHFQDIPVAQFIDNSLAENRVLEHKYKVRFTFLPCDKDLMIHIDPDRMTQVMTNLLSNAAKFSPDNGVIELSARRSDAGIRITVKDQGKGIPLEFQSRIFEKFTQADTSDSRHITGTGLGLHISKTIVECHGGALSFDSQPGKGASFYIDLGDGKRSGAGPRGNCEATT